MPVPCPHVSMKTQKKSPSSHPRVEIGQTCQCSIAHCLPPIAIPVIAMVRSPSTFHPSICPSVPVAHTHTHTLLAHADQYCGLDAVPQVPRGLRYAERGPRADAVPPAAAPDRRVSPQPRRLECRRARPPSHRLWDAHRRALRAAARARAPARAPGAVPGPGGRCGAAGGTGAGAEGGGALAQCDSPPVESVISTNAHEGPPGDIGGQCGARALVRGPGSCGRSAGRMAPAPAPTPVAHAAPVPIAITVAVPFAIAFATGISVAVATALASSTAPAPTSAAPPAVPPPHAVALPKPRAIPTLTEGIAADVFAAAPPRRPTAAAAAPAPGSVLLFVRGVHTRDHRRHVPRCVRPRGAVVVKCSEGGCPGCGQCGSGRVGVAPKRLFRRGRGVPNTGGGSSPTARSPLYLGVGGSECLFFFVFGESLLRFVISLDLFLAVHAVACAIPLIAITT